MSFYLETITTLLYKDRETFMKCRAYSLFSLTHLFLMAKLDVILTYIRQH